MAKMFYTLEEVCMKLGKTEDEIKEMARSGQLQEFRDRDKLMFKVEQINLLAGGEEDTDEVHLALEDTSGSSGLALTGDSTEDSTGGSAIGLADSREETGVSVFDTDHGGEDDSDQTQAGDAVEEELGLDAVGSGSGLLDLTKESDDTSLGAKLLEEVYSSEENVEIPAHASGLFEAAGAESPGDQVTETHGMSMPVVVEAYDGGGSGLGAGLLIGTVAALVCVAIVAIVGTTGATPGLAIKFASGGGSLWMWVGGLGGMTLILGVIGLFIGKATE